MTITLTGATSAQQEMADAFFNRYSHHLSNYQISVTISGFRHSSVEGFKLEGAKKGTQITITIGLTLEHALRYALNAALRWIKSNADHISVEDGPDFPIRGVVEGFYGAPWSHQQRLRALEHFGDFNMNTYFLAPKDDPLQRFNWRSPFSDSFMQEAKELTEHGKRHAINFVGCVSPGLSVQYSLESDVNSVIHRFTQLAKIGVKHFAILWDDISWELQHPEDIERYVTTAQAQAEFSNKVWDALSQIDNSFVLTICPMQYSGRGKEEYLIDLGRDLKSRINIMWTGRQIISEYLDIADAVIFERSALRPALYWDNFPVNDGSLQHSLFIGPVRGREVGLHKYSSGLVSNPMVQFEASILPVATVGDYLWNSNAYNPEESWERALVDLYPKEDERLALRKFFRCTMGTPVGGDPAPDLRKVFNAAATAWRKGDMTTASDLFKKAGEEILEAHKSLTSTSFTHSLLIAEIAPWIEKFKTGGEVLQGLAHVLSQCTFDQEKRAIIGTSSSQSEILALKEQLSAHRKNLFGDQIEGPLNELAAELKTYE